MEVSFGDLVDQLVVVNLKIWHLVEAVESPQSLDAAVADAARKMHLLNRQRVQLKNALNQAIGQSHEELKLPPRSPEEPR